MKCVICDHPDLLEGTTTVTFDRGPTTLVYKDVPAQVCPNCGERFVDPSIAAQLLVSAKSAPISGKDVEVHHYPA